MNVRVGFYICHCGINIAYKVDVQDVAACIQTLPGVEVSRDYQFMCSDPGQDMIIQDIQDFSLNRVVVASCSPRMHEKTFQNACRRAGLNPYLFQMTCVREHCSWVIEDSEEATAKAKHLAAAAVFRVQGHEKLYPRQERVHPDVLVVGGGIAGMQAALDVAHAGHQVHLVEKSPAIGGHMLQFDKTFPTMDCAACIGTPKMVDVGQNPNINLLTYSEVKEVSGFIGNYQVTVHKKPRYVDIDKCTGCGDCAVTYMDEEIQPREHEGQLWVDRIKIDEAKCIQCGACIQACREENPENPALSSILHQRMDSGSEQPIEPPSSSAFQRLLGMNQQERQEFWRDKLSKCIKCYGCIDQCPVHLGEPEKLRLSRWIQPGQVPPQHPDFHLLRAYQIFDACILCGECESTCPASIPIKALQDLVCCFSPELVFELVPGSGKEVQEAIIGFVHSQRTS